MVFLEWGSRGGCVSLERCIKTGLPNPPYMVFRVSSGRGEEAEGCRITLTGCEVYAEAEALRCGRESLRLLFGSVSGCVRM